VVENSIAGRLRGRIFYLNLSELILWPLRGCGIFEIFLGKSLQNARFVFCREFRRSFDAILDNETSSRDLEQEQCECRFQNSRNSGNWTWAYSGSENLCGDPMMRAGLFRPRDDRVANNVAGETLICRVQESISR